MAVLAAGVAAAAVVVLGGPGSPATLARIDPTLAAAAVAVEGAARGAILVYSVKQPVAQAVLPVRRTAGTAWALEQAAVVAAGGSMETAPPPIRRFSLPPPLRWSVGMAAPAPNSRAKAKGARAAVCAAS